MYGKIITMVDINKNQIYEATIEGFTSEGLGVCRINGRAVFVKGALPGETWRLRIVKAGKTAVYARGETCLGASPERTEPGCPLFGRCGGCGLMHMSYREELKMKLARVNDAFRRIGGLQIEASEIIPADAILRYRNKSVYNISEGNGVPVFGFYRSGSHDVVSAQGCPLQSETADAAAAAVCAWMKSHKISAYNDKSGKGAVRHVFVRSARDGSAVCCVVSAEGFGKHTAFLVSALREACPELTGIVLCINKTRGNTMLAGDFYTLWGNAELRDVLCGFEFLLSPQSFFQINPVQAEKLYDLAVGFAMPDSGGTILDLYCGAGTISLCLARRAEKVIGAEIVPEAVENARENARLNGITNAEFLLGDAAEAAKNLADRGIHPDAVVVDPPRKGLSPEVIDEICRMAPERMVYVSCNPASLARDLKRFSEFGYAPSVGIAVDMFPRTTHVETVVLLSKLKSTTSIEVKIDLDEMDLTKSESKATYDEIKQCVLDKFGLKVSQLYIAQVKRKHGIIERDNYNTGEGKAKVPQAPTDKEKAIEDALRYFRMI